MTYPFDIIEDEFKDKRVLVTGGTKGMGESIVRRFQLGGALVATTARSALPSGQTPDLFVEADISTAAGVEDVLQAVMAKWGGVDILVNNVGGTGQHPGGFRTITDDQWQQLLALNLFTAVRFDRALIPGMIERGGGVVVHIGSIAHLKPSTIILAYGAVKAALRTYSKGLAREVAPSGVRVNMISPGFIETPASRVTLETVASNAGIDLEAARERIMQTLGGIPVGRPGQPEEIAELVSYLASERAAFISGVNYIVDGGTVPTT